MNKQMSKKRSGKGREPRLLRGLRRNSRSPGVGGAEKSGNRGSTFPVERRAFWSTHLLSVSSFPESPNLASGCVLLDYGLKRQLLGFRELDWNPQEATTEGVAPPATVCTGPQPWLPLAPLRPWAPASSADPPQALQAIPQGPSAQPLRAPVNSDSGWPCCPSGSHPEPALWETRGHKWGTRGFLLLCQQLPLRRCAKEEEDLL